MFARSLVSRKREASNVYAPLLSIAISACSLDSRICATDHVRIIPPSPLPVLACSLDSRMRATLTMSGDSRQQPARHLRAQIAGRVCAVSRQLSTAGAPPARTKSMHAQSAMAECAQLVGSCHQPARHPCITCVRTQQACTVSRQRNSNKSGKGTWKICGQSIGQNKRSSCFTFKSRHLCQAS
eukprot:1144703-Pelagomonas_calceolata.AAC.10